jgi:hypothetical protein
LLDSPGRATRKPAGFEAHQLAGLGLHFPGDSWLDWLGEQSFQTLLTFSDRTTSISAHRHIQYCWLAAEWLRNDYGLQKLEAYQRNIKVVHFSKRYRRERQMKPCVAKEEIRTRLRASQWKIPRKACPFQGTEHF